MSKRRFFGQGELTFTSNIVEANDGATPNKKIRLDDNHAAIEHPLRVDITTAELYVNNVLYPPTSTPTTIAVGTTSTLGPGSPATVTNTGTPTAAVLAFGIPEGLQGSNGTNGTNGTAATIAVGTVSALPPGSTPTFVNVGTPGAAIFNVGLTTGNTGTAGIVTLAAVGASPNANGATLTGSTLALQPASATLPGVVSTAAQSVKGLKTFADGLAFANDKILYSGNQGLLQTCTPPSGTKRGIIMGYPTNSKVDGDNLVIGSGSCFQRQGTWVTEQNNVFGDNTLNAMTEPTQFNNIHGANNFDNGGNYAPSSSLNNIQGQGNFSNNSGGNGNNIQGSGNIGATGTYTGNSVLGDNNMVASVGNNNHVVGKGIEVSGDNGIYIKNSGTQIATTCNIGGISGVTASLAVPVVINSSGKLGTVVSAMRFKDIHGSIKSSDQFDLLNPVAYNIKELPKETRFGLIAEEVEKLYPELVVYEADGTTPFTIQYMDLIAILIAEVQALKKKVLLA